MLWIDEALILSRVPREAYGKVIIRAINASGRRELIQENLTSNAPDAKKGIDEGDFFCNSGLIGAL
jgi:hypothetical protein